MSDDFSLSTRSMFDRIVLREQLKARKIAERIVNQYKLPESEVDMIYKIIHEMVSVCTWCHEILQLRFIDSCLH